MSDDPLQPTPFQAPTIEELDVLMDGYKFESFIARGGMGAVYLARQSSLDRLVAIKILPRELGDDVAFRESFQAEAKHMARLNHPNLIGIFDFGHIDGMLYIIMEYVKGKSLHERAHGKAIVQKTAAEIIRDICLGLEHAHEDGILHRDIKPANILLGKKSTPKIGDFGLARPTESSESGIIYGTPGYAAPEVLNAADDIDVRTDIFAVGVMFYELLTGSMPEDEYIPVSDLAEVDERFDAIVKKAIQPKPEDRYDSAEDLADAISEVLKEIEEGNNKPVNPLLRAKSKVKKAPKLVAPAVGKSTSNKVLAAASTSKGEGGVKLKSAAPSSSDGESTAMLKASTEPSSFLKSSTPGGNVLSAVSHFSSNNSTRNIVIILLLLIAVYGALQFKSSKEEKVAKIEAKAKAEKAKKDAIKAKIDAERAEERRLAAEARRKERERRNQLRGGNPSRITDDPTDDPPVDITDRGSSSPEIVMRQLENSKFNLASGSRDKSIFPASVVFRDNDRRAVMFIDIPMTWDEADKWASEHGAYLAVCQAKGDVSQYSKMINGSDNAWLGGGNNGNKGWVWIDGSRWHDYSDLPATKKRAFASVSKYGNINAQSRPTTKLPFLIEWRLEKTAGGSINPGSVEERLKRARIEVDGRSINPKYPVGSVSIATRTYCPVYREMTHLRAEQLAAKSGGHLLVLSNEKEIVYVEKYINSLLLPNTECWIGGSKINNLWRWATGESWVQLPWLSGYPKEGSKLKMVTGDFIKLKDAENSDLAPMFIIEWSDDKDNVTKNTSSGGASDNGKGMKKLNDWHEAKLEKALIAANKKYLANVRKLTFDLEFYLKGLPRNVRAQEEGNVMQIHELARSGDRMPVQLSGQGPSEKVRDITTYGVKKQEVIRVKLDKDIEKLRLLYIRHLKNYRVSMTSKGQISILGAIDEAIESAGRNADDYRECFNN